MLTPEQEQLFTLAQKLYQLGYRREWILGDELWCERKQQPGFYHIEYVFQARNGGYLFIRRHARTLRISLNDETLIHIPRTEDVLDWFKRQRWIDFYTLRNEADASYEFTFYYHQRAAYQTFRHTDSRFITLQAMLAAYELMVQIIAD